MLKEDIETLRYEEPPRFSEQAMRVLEDYGRHKGQNKESEIYREFTINFHTEIKSREATCDRNISNFKLLCDLNIESNPKRGLVKQVIAEYHGRPGFYYRHEGDGRWLKEHHRTGRPEQMHMLCKFEEALAF